MFNILSDENVTDYLVLSKKSRCSGNPVLKNGLHCSVCSKKNEYLCSSLDEMGNSQQLIFSLRSWLTLPAVSREREIDCNIFSC